ncbi:MAG: protein kinase domain-containing protein [Waterburya sp.]
MESIVGKILCDRYRILQELSQDDFSTVYVAEDLGQTGKPKCQIERLQPRYDSEVLGTKSWQQILQAFIAEGNVLKNISQHPQIPQLLTFFECDRHFYLVQEFIPGESLAQKLTNSTINEAEAIEWLQEILRVLEFIHQAGVIHLNIQPASLFQEQAGKKFLTNFAKIKNAVVFNKQFTQTVTNLDFAPLEQQRGKPDFSSDIYALGKTIIYALTGQVADFIQVKSSNSETNQTALKIQNIATANIRPELVDILNTMVGERPSQRYQSASEVLAKLDFERQNVVIFPPAFSNTPGVYARPSRTKNQVNFQRQAKERSKFWRVILWSLLTLPFIVASVIIFIGINKNAYKDFDSYVNDDYQFQLKYPQDWSNQELSDPITGGVAVFASPLETDADLFQEKVYITVEYLASEPTTLEEYTNTVLERIKQQKGNEIEVYQDRKTTIAKLPARMVIYSRKEDGLQLRQMEVFTIQNNQVYIAIYTAERAKFSKFLDTAEKIINSWEIE